MRSVNSIFLLIVALVIGSPAAVGEEVTVRQGESPVQSFQSPMILEVSLPSPANLKVGASRSVTPDLSKFACDGVTLSQLQITLTRRSGGANGTLILEVSGILHVPVSVDRLVDLVFIAKKGDAILGRGERRKIDAEEDKNAKFRTKLTLSQPRYEAAFSGEPVPVLEITMAVGNNG